NGYANGGFGTSYAAPQVSAAAALVKDQFPNLSAYQIMERVRSTTDDIYDIGSNDIYDGKLGKGRLNIFNAVTATNVKSMRAIDITASTGNDGLVFFGDTVEITNAFVNYLSPINDPFINLSSPDNQFDIIQSESAVGFLNTGDTARNAFTLVLKDEIEPNTAISIRMDFNEGSYQDFQFYEITTAPSYVDFGNSNTFMTLSSNGNLALNSYDDRKGSGFIYHSDTVMKYAGFLLATNDSTVSDNMISDYSTFSRDQDFSIQRHFKIQHHPSADYFGYTEFTDEAHSLLIEQSSYAWQNEDFLIVSYRLVNTSETPINNLTVATYADWDLADSSSNRAFYNDSLNYVLTQDSEEFLYAGMQMIGGDTSTHNLIDLTSTEGNSADVEGFISDEVKYQMLTDQYDIAAGLNGSGNNVAVLQGTTINEIAGLEEETVHVIYTLSSNIESLEAHLLTAPDRIRQVTENPRVLETIFTCDGTSTQIDLESGTFFELYEDAKEQTLITIDSIFTITGITSDTIFYVKNVDLGYPSDLFEIRIKLFEDIADFEVSTDTLYLDHPTTNIIHFTDKSLDAISWNWNFGNGTSSTIQNPSLNFSNPGEYLVELTVRSAQGCEGSMIRTIIVAERPEPPNLDPITSCPSEDVIVNIPDAEKIQLYAFEDQTIPSVVGTNLTIPKVTKDTIVYVSGTYDGFQSSKSP
ncbi:MAG: PKD domain-containing protein, partial [Ekhidna sp.]|nr:PKD domain-containing protein [Ekhidna sp.]